MAAQETSSAFYEPLELIEGAQGSDQQLPPYPEPWLALDNYVVDIQSTSKPKYFKDRGITNRYTVDMSDGSRYKMNIGLPKHQISPIVDASTTPYTTGLNGVNFHHLLKGMEHGFVTIKISAERQWEGKLTQVRTAHNQLRIISAVTSDEDLTPGTNQDASIYTGVSRGGMLALGMRALAELDNHFVPYMNLTVPCYPRRATISSETLEQPIKEGAALVRHLGSLPLRLLLKYRSSTDFSKEGLQYTVASIPMLTSGETGSFVPFIPKDAHGYITTYNDDLMCMGDVWQKDFEGHLDIHIVDASGTDRGAYNAHLRCINYEDFLDFSGRQQRLASELGRTIKPSEIDYDFITWG